MSISEWAIRIIALVLAILGLLLVLAALGHPAGVSVPMPWWIEGLIGLGLIGVGYILIRGGTVTA